jgi:formylglycine-generating enzyme required for sulfatase activity
MSLPENRMESVVSKIDRLRARTAIFRGIEEERLMAVSPIDVLSTAIDLHILAEDPRHQLGFSHRTVRQLLATMTVDTDYLISTLDSQRREVGAHDRSSQLPADSAEFGSEVTGLAVAAAQLRGDEFTRQLATTDPVLAAQAHVAARFDTGGAVAQYICHALHKVLAEAKSVARSIGALEALSLMGWRYPEPTAENLGDAMHRIPAREWHLGSSIESGNGEIDKILNYVSSERRSVELRAFWISDAPVTNAEYAGFVDAGGYDDQKFWTVAGWDWRTRRGATEQLVANWARKRDALRRHPERIVRLLREGRASPAQAAALVRFIELDEREFAAHAGRNYEQPITAPMFWESVRPDRRLHPVVGVSWYEANAFCAWKSQYIGRTVRLPTENEWEAACVWRLESKPLGNSINSIEHGLGDTTPVGAFDLAGDPEDSIVKDLMGNCFEWTFDYYEPGEHVSKIVKGGSWRQEKWRAHPAYRGRGDANLRTDDTGFRYVIPESGS